MKSSDVIDIIVISLILFLPIGLDVFNLHMVKNEIRDDLQKRGATNIRVIYNWLGSGWSSKTFTATYTDAQGNRKSAQCELKGWGTFLFSKIIWQDAVILKPTNSMSKHSRPRSNEESEKNRSNRDS
jgi:hypothetical protein